MNKGYNHAVDWWAVGVLIYEMRCGKSPFEARSQLEMFKRISRRDFKYPRDFTDDEQELIGGLLQVRHSSVPLEYPCAYTVLSVNRWT